MQPHRWQPTRLPRPWDSPGKNTGVGCRFLFQCMKVKSESEVAQSCLTPRNPMDCSQPAPPSVGFSRQEYWSGVPSPSPFPTAEVRKQWPEDQILPFLWIKITKPYKCPLFYVLPVDVLALQRQSWVVVIETIWLIKLKILISEPWQKMSDNSWPILKEQEF